ncbi:MAG TPA: hypothetical protein VGE02_06495 [Gemmatimonadales bacterium]
MFGCLGRIGCLALVLVIGAAAWFTRDRWYPVLAGERVVAVDPSSTAWEPVTPAAGGRGQEVVRRLAEARGPSAVALGPAEAASYVLAGVLRDLPQSASGLEASITGDRLYLRASIALGDLGGDVLGPLAGMVSERETLMLGGTIDMVRPGLAQFRVAEVRVRDFSLPSRVIPRLLDRLRGSRALPEGVADDGIPLELPGNVADVRVSRGRVTLYEEVPGDVSF